VHEVGTTPQRDRNVDGISVGHPAYNPIPDQESKALAANLFTVTEEWSETEAARNVTESGVT